ncbi:MAG: ABC transporter permease, partial [Saprospiraceae bacterium]
TSEILRLVMKTRFFIQNQCVMLQNYFKIALRNLFKDHLYTLINITGLALGMMSVLLILFYVKDELSYDTFFKDHDNIHRIAIDIKTQDNKNLLFAPVTSMLPEALRDYSQVAKTTRLYPAGSRLVSAGPEKVFYETTFAWADPNVFEVFSFQFLHGNPKTALDAPMKMVVTRATAKKYFGTTAVVGKTLKVNEVDYQITGVIEDLPSNAHFQVGFLASLTEHYNKEWFPNWHATMFYTYVKLKPGTDVKAFEAQIHDIADKYVGNEIRQNAQYYRFFLQPLTSIHLHPDLRYELGKNNSYRQIQILSAIAIIILIIAAFNFINLATARATRQAKEVGIRKTVGSQRKHLILQFMLESLLLCTLAMVLALMGIWLVLPWFNQIADK